MRGFFILSEAEDTIKLKKLLSQAAEGKWVLDGDERMRRYFSPEKHKDGRKARKMKTEERAPKNDPSSYTMYHLAYTMCHIEKT